ncbi:hypothetical protein MATR_19270 [Marivirga tractuosa]|uniref:Uncharacterized protein n=1 Tax=Marivirga tractuosa (strain ATCC 23168 / DSM 4126 / NBRC 15989 / NCIMB 1408 / VKM B-1430 / H-43) TaxID=643867 RepID=E4TNJ6_MARTH|nr:hypothetical protein Ftrac_0447 [Marivirga tractuosa DSM 4126]BDD15102.1 hypothetical protein MATR_19270 [Marivirga tractuosa]
MLFTTWLDELLVSIDEWYFRGILHKASSVLCRNAVGQYNQANGQSNLINSKFSA